MSIWDDVTGWLKGAGESVDWGNVLALGGSYMLNQSGANSAQVAPTGYQGSIPTYAAVRSPVEVSVPTNYRPGSAGRRYFSDTRYVAPDSAAAETAANRTEAIEKTTLPEGEGIHVRELIGICNLRDNYLVNRIAEL